jgi:hypothetical protein
MDLFGTGNLRSDVHSRSIMDNALISFETLHHMWCKHNSKVGEVALKLDISKAFDNVNWSSLKVILVLMGFNFKWVSWMMMCITSVEYHVLFNNDRIWPITPLSPYLYILCAEGLSFIIKNYELRGKLHGTCICWSEPPINHLDSLWCF